MTPLFFKRLGLIVLLGIILWGVQRSSAPHVRQFTKTGEFFGSYVKVDICFTEERHADLDGAVAKVWERFADIHSRMSVYDPASDINKINAAYAAPVQVGADTYQLIKDSLEYHRLSGGVFDITLGPLITLWKLKGGEGVMPTADEIKRARALVNMAAVELMDNRQIRLTRKGVKVNIDSIGDGFAADEAARILRSFGFEDFLIDASGELYAGGLSCRGTKWRIGIRDPQDPESLIDVVEVCNLAVSTSGSYEQFYEIDGKPWSHIIDPRSGFPARGIKSATVIAPSARFADFLSTALCVLSGKEGLVLVDKLGANHAAMVVLDDDSGSELKRMSGRYIQYQAAPSVP